MHVEIQESRTHKAHIVHQQRPHLLFVIKMLPVLVIVVSIPVDILIITYFESGDMAQTDRQRQSDYHILSLYLFAVLLLSPVR